MKILDNTTTVCILMGLIVLFMGLICSFVNAETGTLQSMNNEYEIRRVSVSSEGEEGDGYSYSYSSSMSANGRYVVFGSDASNLVSGDKNSATDIFVHDRISGTTTRVSVSSKGVEGDNVSHSPSMSADGKYIVFASRASNLVSNDKYNNADIFVHDRISGTTTRVSVSSKGVESFESSSQPSISADGRYVAFGSYASNLVHGDTNNSEDVFIHDRISSTTTRISVSSEKVEGDDYSYKPSMSADGKYIVFASRASNLVSDDKNGTWDIFVHDRINGTTTRVSISFEGAEGDSGSDSPSISADGRYIAFLSLSSNLTPDDTNGVADIFVHDRVSSTTTRISISSEGTEDNDDYSHSPSISADGRYIAFGSYASNLVSDDTNNKEDIFVHDRISGTTTRVSISSEGVEGNYYSHSPSISADGRYISFTSGASNLVSNDINNHDDIFVVRNPLLDKAIDSLEQFKSDGKTPLENGGVTAGDTVVFKAQISPFSGYSLKLQIEMQKYPDAFMQDPDADDARLLNSDLVSAGGIAAATSTILEDGEYHWRARAVSETGFVSSWQYYEGVEDYDLKIKVVPLYTQVVSEYPSLVDTEDWFDDDFAFASSTSPYKGCGYTIAKCGCAITSVVMALRHSGITENVEGNDVNPGTINEWLKNPKGYFGEGLVGYYVGGNINWSAINNYSEDSNIYLPRAIFSGIYSGTPDNLKGMLDNDLASGSSVILWNNTEGHFIVATEELADTYRVNDSVWYNTKTLNQEITDEDRLKDRNNRKNDYNNHYDGIRRFSFSPPSDFLGYIPNIYLVLASPAELLITAPSGDNSGDKKLGYDPIKNIKYSDIEGGSYTNEGIGNIDNPGAPYHKTKTIWIPNPIPGKYTIQVIGTGEGEYHLYSHNTDTGGDFKADSFVSNITQGEMLEYILDYNPENIEESEIIPLVVDTTPPEAKIYFDTEKEKMLVIGIDDITENSEVSMEENCTKEIRGKCLKKEYVYIITDNAGNTLKLWMEKITHKNNVLARIKKIQYNEDEPINTKASLHYVWKKDQDNNMKFLSQTIREPQDFILNTNYHLLKDETKISGYDQEKRQVIRENLSGLIIINLLTKQGQFQYEY